MQHSTAAGAGVGIRLVAAHVLVCKGTCASVGCLVMPQTKQHPAAQYALVYVRAGVYQRPARAWDTCVGGAYKPFHSQVLAHGLRPRGFGALLGVRGTVRLKLPSPVVAAAHDACMHMHWRGTSARMPLPFDIPALPARSGVMCVARTCTCVTYQGCSRKRDCATTNLKN